MIIKKMFVVKPMKYIQFEIIRMELSFLSGANQ